MDTEGAIVAFLGHSSKYYPGVVEENHRIVRSHDES
jgi:hypothetical protein